MITTFRVHGVGQGHRVEGLAAMAHEGHCPRSIASAATGMNRRRRLRRLRHRQGDAVDQQWFNKSAVQRRANLAIKTMRRITICATMMFTVFNMPKVTLIRPTSFVAPPAALGAGGRARKRPSGRLLINRNMRAGMLCL